MTSRHKPISAATEAELVRLLSSSREEDVRRGEELLRALGSQAGVVLSRIRESRLPGGAWLHVGWFGLAALVGLLLAGPAYAPVVLAVGSAGAAAAGVALLARRLVVGPARERAVLRGLTALHEQAALSSLLLLLGADPRAAGRAFGEAMTPDRRDARAEVVRLLGEMQPDAALAEMRRASFWLYGPLANIYEHGPSADHLVALLQLIERCGDAQALLEVRWAARAEAATQSERRVKDAAESCMRRLEALAAEEHSAQVLLRPADAPGGGVRLLRPASAVAEADPELLLRPVAREE